MRAARNPDAIPTQFAGVKLFVDLSSATLAKHKELAPVTRAVRDADILYKWSGTLDPYNGRGSPAAKRMEPTHRSTREIRTINWQPQITRQDCQRLDYPT
ncbi:Hypothetical predicted protein [Pelobates cultripes]|uniref:Uncharacterized protein n=1 Tax=Pelobates cultripes TaxID=61616 RepID=A0AAD1SWB2_PELCU|nr:Hypothetical predicted protein [Pelobates cultripes]